MQEECLGDISNHNNPFLEKWNGNGFSRMYIAGKNVYQHGTSVSINSTKGNPCLQADIFGDWREEMIFYDGSNPSVLNIFTTNIPTSYRVVTLMHDHVYRMGVCWQNTAYNQPPHLGYYLPDYIDGKLPSSIGNITTVQQETEQVFDAQGRQLNSLHKGLNIVRKNGRVKKVLVL